MLIRSAATLLAPIQYRLGRLKNSCPSLFQFIIQNFHSDINKNSNNESQSLNSIVPTGSNFNDDKHPEIGQADFENTLDGFDHNISQVVRDNSVVIPINSLISIGKDQDLIKIPDICKIISISKETNNSAEIVDLINKLGKGFSSDNSGDGPKNKGKKNNNKNKIMKGLASKLVKDVLSEYIGNTGATIAVKAANRIGKTVKNKSKNRSKKNSSGKQKTLIYRSYAEKDGTLTLSNAASKYLHCNLKPFDQNSKATGVPRPGSLPSYKVTGYLRGTAYVGGKGFGFVTISPTLANNTSCVQYTTSVYDSDVISYIGTDAPGVDTYNGNANSPASAIMSNLPFTVTNLTQVTTSGLVGVEGRISSVSLSATYVGTVLTKSGQFYTYSDPDCIPVVCPAHDLATPPSGEPTVATLSSKEACEIRPVGNRPVRLLVVPQSPNLSDYPNNSSNLLRKVYPYSQGNYQIANRGLPMAVIAFTGSPGSPIFWEAVIHCEYVGPSVPQSSLTPSYSDAVGFDTVQMILQKAVRNNATDPYKTLEQCIKEEMRNEKVAEAPYRRRINNTLNGNNGSYTNTDDHKMKRTCFYHWLSKCNNLQVKNINNNKRIIKFDFEGTAGCVIVTILECGDYELKFVRRRNCNTLNGNNGSWTNTDDHEILGLNMFKRIYLFFLIIPILSLIILSLNVSLLEYYYTYKLVFTVVLWLLKGNVVIFNISLNPLNYFILVLIFHILYKLLVGYKYFNNTPFENTENNVDGKIEEIKIEIRNTVSQKFNNLSVSFRQFIGFGLITNKVKNKGNGGNSKSEEEPISDNTEAADRVNEKEKQQVEDLKELIKKRKKHFIHSDPPNLQTVFSEDKIVANKNYMMFDCHGNPFCGLTCVDIAIGIKPDFDSYCKRINEKFDEVGSVEFLIKYCNYRGYNLAVMFEGRIEKYCNSVNWDYIFLNFTSNLALNENGVNYGHWTLVVSEDISDLTKNHDSILPLIGCDRNEYVIKPYKTFLFGLIEILFIFKITKEFRDYDCIDKREVTQRRDDIEVVDTYANFVSSFRIQIPSLNFCSNIDNDLPFNVILWFKSLVISFEDYFVNSKEYFSYLFLNLVSRLQLEIYGLYKEKDSFNINNIQHLLVEVKSDNYIEYLILRIVFTDFNRPPTIGLTIIHMLMSFIFCENENQVLSLLQSLNKSFFREYFPVHNGVISVQKFKKCLLEFQNVLKPEFINTCVSLISQTRYISTNAQITNIIYFTTIFTRNYLTTLNGNAESWEPTRIAVNARGSNSIVANLDVIKNNRDRVMEAIGLGETPRDNAIVKAVNKIEKINYPIGFAPKIIFKNSNKQLGPGKYPITDTPSILAAAAGRSCNKDRLKVNEEVLEEFKIFAFKQADYFLNSCNLGTVQEEDPRDAIERLYKGKKPRKFIESLVESYTDYLNGKSNKKFKQCSSFVKFENSSKKSGGEVRVKPRMIMMMSDLMLIEYCQILDVINKWNDSSFGKFQIKHMTPEDMIKKISTITNKEHLATDYSSFECSIIGVMREIEDYTIMKSLKLSGLKIARKRYRKDFIKPRKLHSLDNVIILNSRNSGDFHTSWMNGFINYLVSAYSYLKSNPDDEDLINFQLVAEGDDGLRKPTAKDEEVAKDLGFSFSASVNGTQNGDVDFLKMRWINGFKLLNVPKYFKLAWVMPGKYLKRSRCLQILRCSALSLHYMSPGHPILWALVKRIDLETRGIRVSRKMTKLIKSYKDMYHFSEDFDIIEEINNKPFPEVSVNKEARKYVALGALEFKPISVSCQIALEEQFLDRKNDIFELFDLFKGYDEIDVFQDQEYKPNPTVNLNEISGEMSELYKILNLERKPPSLIIKNQFPKLSEIELEYNLKFEA